MQGDVLLAFALTTVAGLSTGIGSAIALFAKRTNAKFLAASLGFSAGVMIYVSLVELMAEAKDSLQASLGTGTGAIATVVAFFGGMLLIGIIDRLVPKEENPHEFKNTESISLIQDRPSQKNTRLMRTGVFTALAIAIHNFPEGLATFVSALQEPAIALPIVVAIALHNIPEGIAVSMPIFYATGNRKKAFFYSFASGLSEPLGAILGYLILMPFLNEAVMGIIFAGVAGVMVFISFDELLPASREYGEHHLSVYGLIAGMAVMAVSLLFLSF